MDSQDWRLAAMRRAAQEIILEGVRKPYFDPRLKDSILQPEAIEFQAQNVREDNQKRSELYFRAAAARCQQISEYGFRWPSEPEGYKRDTRIDLILGAYYGAWAAFRTLDLDTEIRFLLGLFYHARGLDLDENHERLITIAQGLYISLAINRCGDCHFHREADESVEELIWRVLNHPLGKAGELLEKQFSWLAVVDEERAQSLKQTLVEVKNSLVCVPIGEESWQALEMAMPLVAQDTRSYLDDPKSKELEDIKIASSMAELVHRLQQGSDQHQLIMAASFYANRKCAIAEFKGDWPNFRRYNDEILRAWELIVPDPSETTLSSFASQLVNALRHRVALAWREESKRTGFRFSSELPKFLVEVVQQLTDEVRAKVAEMLKEIWAIAPKLHRHLFYLTLEKAAHFDSEIQNRVAELFS